MSATGVRLVFRSDLRVEVERFAVPEPGARQVLVRVARSQVSAGSEMNFYRLNPPDGPLRRTPLGYMTVGRVERVGPGVAEFAPGDRVLTCGHHASHWLVDLTDTGADQANGNYMNLMATLNDGLTAFYNDLANQGLINQTLILQFSEFGRRISENGSNGTDHGSAGVMMVMGGRVQGGLYGTSASLNTDPQNPTLENAGNDITFETDFRSAYARVIDNWLGGNSVSILGGNFQKASLNFV